MVALRAITFPTYPTDLPFPVSEMKAHSHITASAEDDTVQSCLIDATTLTIDLLGRPTKAQNFEYALDRFPREVEGGLCKDLPILLFKTPVRKILSFTYQNTDGDTVELAEGTDFVVDYLSPVARIAPKSGTSWPVDVADEINAINIQYTAGYGTVADVSPGTIPAPYDMLRAIKLLAAFWIQYGDGAEIGSGLTVAEYPRPFAYNGLIEKLQVVR